MKSSWFRSIMQVWVLLILMALQGGVTNAGADIAVSQHATTAPDWEDVIEKAGATLQRDPNSIEALRMLGEAHIAIGDTLEGMIHLKKALSIQPHNAPCLVMLVETLLARGEGSEADKYVTAAEAKDSRGQIWEIKASRASILAMQGQIPEALRILSEAAAKNPRNSLYLKLLARLYRDRNILELSIDNYRRAIELDPGNAQLRFELAQVLLKDKQFEEAMSEFKAVQERDTVNLEVNYQIGKLYFAAGSYDEALEPLQAATRDRPDHFLSHYLLGQTLRQLGRLPEAEASLKKSIEIRPQRQDVQKLLVRTLAEEKKYEEEITLLDSMALHSTADPELLTMKGDAYYTLASGDSDLVSKSQHYDSALVYYKRSLFIFPIQNRTAYRVATIHYNSDQFDSAAVYYKKTLQLQPGNCGAMINMGYSYGRLGKWTEAISALRQGTDCDKSNITARSYLASILAAQDSLDAAIGIYSDVISLDSENCESYGQIGLIYFNREEYIAAIRNLLQAVTYCPKRTDFWRLYGYANWAQFLKIRENIRDSHDGLIPGDELLKDGGSYLKAAEKGFEQALKFDAGDNDLKENLKAVTNYLKRLTGE